MMQGLQKPCSTALGRVVRREDDDHPEDHEMKRPASRASEHDDTAAVTALLVALEHPLKPAVEAARHAILGADSAITEGVKWSSPSFYRHGWFATIRVRPKAPIQIVLHHGAKTQTEATLQQTIEDPSRLLTWKSPDRAIISFDSTEDFATKQMDFVALIRQWAAYQTQLHETAS